jgi:hypothetical protein
VLCAVVDPGVGTDRRAIAVDAGGVLCVAPDNGIVSYLWDETPPGERSAVALDIPAYASSTFHGRDVFAPAAAQLASGARLADVGEPIRNPVALPEALAAREPGVIRGRVAVVDHFGNAITTVRARDVGGAGIARVTWSSGATAAVVSTYAEITSGIAALFGSTRHLELAARGLPAASAGAPARGEEITVELA